MWLMFYFFLDNNRLTEKDSCLLMSDVPSFRKSGCRLSGTEKENSYMHVQNGGSPNTSKIMMMMMMMMIMIVIVNLIVKKLGDIVIKSRDHAVPLLVPIEVLIKVVFFLN